jgi:replicative DNA helicase
MGEALAEVFGEMEASASRGESVTGITTGYDDLDQILGGWHPQELTILGGRPGMGKSAGGMAFAINAAASKPRDGRMNGVGFFSVEMTRQQLASRTICSMAGVNYVKVKRKCLQPADWNALATAANWMSALPLWVDDYMGLTPAILRSKCRRLKARAEQTGKARLSLVVVDYLQRMKSGLPPEQKRSRQEEVAYISWSLKELSKELDIPIIALAQVNRTSQKTDDKRPKLADLREAGDIEQDADNVIFIHREAYYLKEKTPDEWRDVAEFIVEKQRNGPTDTAFVRFIKDSAKFVNETGLGDRLRGGY